ncbi:MAG: hypothetical protein ACXW65_20995 [Gemmatirosa sp.]
MSSPDDLRAFGDSAQALEAQIADAEARGTPVPPEAHAMLESLRQLSRAIDDLQASLGVEPTADPLTAETEAPSTGDAADGASDAPVGPSTDDAVPSPS